MLSFERTKSDGKHWDMNALKNKLEKKINSRMKIVAEQKRDAAVRIAKEWKADIVGFLSRTHNSHYKSGAVKYPRYAKHASTPPNYSEGYPYKVTGKLRRAVTYRTSNRVKHVRGSKTWSFTVTTIYQRTTARSDGSDYSNILNNTPNRYYSDYKGRATALLHERLRKIVKDKNGIYN